MPESGGDRVPVRLDFLAEEGRIHERGEVSRNTSCSNEIDDRLHKGRLWLVDDVAQYLRISKDEVYRLVERLEIPHTRIFKRKGIRFHPGEIEEWARSIKRPPQSEDVSG